MNANLSSRLFRLIVVRSLGFGAVFLVALACRAPAQDVLSNGDFPFGWVRAFGAANLDDPATRINQGNVTGASGGDPTLGGASKSLRLRAAATVTEDGNAVRDRFRFTLGGNQNFEVVDANRANLWSPTFLRGAITFFQNPAAPNANFAIGSITGTAEYLIWNGASYVPANDASLPAPLGAPLRITLSLDRDAQVNAAGGAIDNTNILRYENAPAGRYQLQLRLTVTGEADAGFLGNSNVGSGVTTTTSAVDANDLYRGLITSVDYAPARALPNSRARVGAVAARTQYGVDGTGSSIGLLEPGRIIGTHTTFGGGKVTQLRERLDMPAGLTDPLDPTTRVADGRSEHATAVGGIAAGSAGDDSQKGIAPGANLISVSAPAFIDDAAGPGAKTSGQKQFDALLGAGATVINMSAVYPDLPATYVDQQMLANNRVTFVKSSGNSGIAGAGANTVTNPGMAYNIITVGALNQDMTHTAAFSSNNNIPGALRKPDIVAPGDYVVIPNAINTNDDALVNDFDRRFTASDARYIDGPVTTGGASGTSFAAPHVSGAVALMQDHARRNPGTFDVNSIDHRVIKAVLLNNADRTVRHGDGTAWTQTTDATGRIVSESLDRQLGAGMLDVSKAMENYAAGEIRMADDNNQQNFKITGQNATPIRTTANGRTSFWDLERVAPAQTGPPPPGGILQNGTVDYILGADSDLQFIAETQTWVGTVRPNFGFLRADLTWDRLTNAAGDAYEPLSNLEIRFYLDGLNDGNVVGYDPNNPNADTLLARTLNPAENEKLLFFPGLSGPEWTFNMGFGAVPPTIWDPAFYVEVVNLSDGPAVDYGITVVVPEPGAGVLLLLAASTLLSARRRCG